MLRTKFLRITRELSQDQLAARTGINRSIISNIENGRVNPRPDELVQLGKALSYKPERLLDRVDGHAPRAGRS